VSSPRFQIGTARQSALCDKKVTCRSIREDVQKRPRPRHAPHAFRRINRMTHTHTHAMPPILGAYVSSNGNSSLCTSSHIECVIPPSRRCRVNPW